MGALRYLVLVALVGLLALLTVTEHVRRTELGYELRKLEKERARLQEEDKAARLAYERAAAPERLVERAEALDVAERRELQGLVGAAPQAEQRTGRRRGRR